MRTLAITTSAAPPTDFTKKLCHIFYAPTSRFLITEVSIRYPDDGAAAAD
jgi:hypothetical protein